MLSYINFQIYESNGVYTIGGVDNVCFDDCTLENLVPSVDELEMVEYCLNNSIKLKFDDLRGCVYDVPYGTYLEHLKRYETDKEHRFLDNEFIVPVAVFSSVEKAKEFIDWLSLRLKEQTKDPSRGISLDSLIKSAAARTSEGYIPDNVQNKRLAFGR